jgi:hypothetical protein
MIPHLRGRRTLMPPRPPVQIADILADALPSAFDALCTERYGGLVGLHRVEVPDAAASTVRFRLEWPGRPSLEAAFRIRHLGGNMYEVQGQIEGLPPQSFGYCLPDPPPAFFRAPRLARDVATFLLDGLERRIGNELLRRTARGAPSPPERPSPAVPPPPRSRRGGAERSA